MAAVGGPPAARERRLAALERFAASALPDATLEDWRYSRIGDLDLGSYAPVAATVLAEAPEALQALMASLSPAVSVVVGHGAAAPDGAGAGGRGEGVAGVTVEVDPAELEPFVLAEADAFGHLNAALGRPVVVRVAPGTRPSGPIVVLHWVAADGTAAFPRTRVEVGAGAEVSVVELVGSPDVDALCVPVTEIAAGDGAVVNYVTVQQLGPRVWQLGRQASAVGRDATFTSSSVALGAGYGRLRTDSALVGKGGTSRLLAVYLGDGRRMVDFRTTQDHRAPNTTSELLFKGAVANRSHAVYTGLIRVDKGARGTNAFQTNRNLVVHEGARADSVPNLEIEDNDVRCSHASAVGPIAPDQRFYLESRGVPPEMADRLITLGFLDEVLARTPVTSVVAHLRLELLQRLDAAERAELAAELESVVA